MHILLTDVLTCPRCGPEFGLILLADRIDDRRVIEGRLGCANCREQYPVRNGVIDVRLPGPGSTESDAPVDKGSADRSSGETMDPAEAAMRLAALLGLADAQGTVLIAGPGVALASEVVKLLPQVEAVALAPDFGDPGPRPGVTRMVGAAAPLPFRGGKLRGVALTGGADTGALAEGLRVLAPGARLVVENAAADAAGALEAMGAQVMLDQDGVVVARAVGQPVQLTVNGVR